MSPIEIPIFTIVFIAGVLCLLCIVAFAYVNPHGGESILGPILGNGKRVKLGSLPKVDKINFPPAPVHLSYWGISAKVALDFKVTIDGRALDIRVIEATHAEVVRPIVEAVSRGTFIPALSENGKPVESRMQLPVFTSKQPEDSVANSSRRKSSARERVLSRSQRKSQSPVARKEMVSSKRHK